MSQGRDLPLSKGMNCFDWQNRASDYLDGTLIGTVKQEADAHLDQCPDCGDRLQRYRRILNAIGSRPRSSLPIPMRRSPLAMALPPIEAARLSLRRWEQIPWYLRTAIEGVGIVVMILAGISAGPRIRALYERGLERNLSDFSQVLGDSEGGKEIASIPLLRGKAVDQNITAQTAEEFSSEDAEGEIAEDDSAGGDTDEDGVQAGSSEIWRFILKTDSPHEVRPKIVKILTDLKVPSETSGLGGIEAPGGIQFDLLIPQGALPSLKRQLQAMAPNAPAELADTPAGETFTWYKNRSKQRLPNGKTRIVIWLSQM